jgi:hypothetical protein
VERWCFRQQFAGEEVPNLYYSDDDPSQGFDSLDGDPAEPLPSGAPSASDPGTTVTPTCCASASTAPRGISMPLTLIMSNPLSMRNPLRRVTGSKERQPSALITGLVGPDKKGGWSVSWAGDGACPPDIHAISLTEAADQAAFAVAALYARYPPVAGAELQLAIYPWDYRGGPMFDIAGQAGALAARDIQGSDRSITGATLEDLVEAVRQMPDIPEGQSMFRWVRQVASLPLSAETG